jgi:hypothetical protein
VAPAGGELEPSWGVAHDGGDLLERDRGDGAQRERDAHRGGRCGGGAFALRVDDPLDADGREEEGRGGLGAEDRGGDIAIADIEGDAGPDVVAQECVAVGAHGVAAARAACDVGVGGGVQLSAGVAVPVFEGEWEA